MSISACSAVKTRQVLVHAWMVFSVEDDGGRDIWLSCTDGATPESPSAALPDDESLSCGLGAPCLSEGLRLNLSTACEMVWCSSKIRHGDLYEKCVAWLICCVNLES